MLPSHPHNARRALAALAGVVALPLGVPGDVAGLATAGNAGSLQATDTVEDVAPELREQAPGDLSPQCLGATICRIKNRMFTGSRDWTPQYCETIAAGVLASARKHDLNPALLLAVMINESDLNEKAFAEHERDGRLYAKDSGLMGIRCVVDDQGKCTNGGVKGRTWKSVMDPLTNIELGARELARYRDGAGVERVTIRKRDKSGRVTELKKFKTCHHRTHAYWAHYNHGPLYIDKGFARHYPHRVAVLYHALAQALKLRAPELERGPITIADPGLRKRTIDRPVEPRYRQLCQIIQSTSGTCGDVVSTSWPNRPSDRGSGRAN